jgi:NADPH-dependent glutamate synthase beta subunit-like oxidoreductase
VRFRTCVRYREIVPAGVLIELTASTESVGSARSTSGACRENTDAVTSGTELIAADVVVTAVGQERDYMVFAALEHTGVPFRMAGAAAGGRDAVQAFEQGMRAAHSLLSLKHPGS